MVGYIKIRRSCNSRWIFITFFHPMNWVRCSFFFMDLKVHPFGFLKRPYLLHSVQMAVTGDFLKKMSEISPPGSLFRIFHFLVVFLLFCHVPPCNKLVAWKWSLIWTMWSQNDRRWVYPAQWSILRGWAVKIPLIPDRPCTAVEEEEAQIIL